LKGKGTFRTVLVVAMRNAKLLDPAISLKLIRVKWTTGEYQKAKRGDKQKGAKEIEANGNLSPALRCFDPPQLGDVRERGKAIQNEGGVDPDI